MLDNSWSIFRAMNDGVQAARRQADFVEDVQEGPVTSWRSLGALDDDGVAHCSGQLRKSTPRNPRLLTCKRTKEGAQPKDTRTIPRSDSHNNAIGLLDYHSTPLIIEHMWNLTLDTGCRNQASAALERFQSIGEIELEVWWCRTDFSRAEMPELILALDQFVCCSQEEITSEARFGLAPSWKGLLCCGNGGICVFHGCR